jgi:hypothetical protein
MFLRIFKMKCQIFSNLGKSFHFCIKFGTKWEKVGNRSRGYGENRNTAKTETICTLACFFERLLAACTSCTASDYGRRQFHRQRLGRRLQCVCVGHFHCTYTHAAYIIKQHLMLCVPHCRRTLVTVTRRKSLASRSSGSTSSAGDLRLCRTSPAPLIYTLPRR